MTPRADLHTHSNRSDGTDTPAELIRKARDAGLDVVALTDHDTTDGWAEAQEAADEVGITFVPGVEVSTRMRGVGVHVLAYNIDPTYPALVSELARVRSDRRDRLKRIVAGLTSVGLELKVDDVMAQASAAATVGRPHVADAMIAKGYVSNRAEAFATWLAEGRPGYVAKYAPETSQAIRLIKAAGGVAVLAHPWGRQSKRALDPAEIAALAAHGLAGIEVDHLDHGDDDKQALRGIASELGLAVTGASDYHGTGKINHPLGAHVTSAAQWERLAA